MDATAAPLPAPGAPRPDAGSSAPAAAAVPRRRRLLGRLLRWVLVLLVLIGLAPLALRLPFVRSWVASRAGASLGAPVEIAGLAAWWTSGIDVDGLVVKSPAGFDGPLATVEHVHVDVGLLDALRGRVAARVTVAKPTLSLRRDAAGRWNHEAVRRHLASGPSSPSDPGARTPTVHVEVSDGAVEAHGLSGRVERISDIDFAADLAADGAMGATLGALVEKAGAKDGDVRLSIAGGLTPGGEHPIEALVPELDLARLAGLIEGFTGLRDLKGTARLEAKGMLTGDGAVRGRLTLAGQGFEARGSGDARVVLGSVSGTVDVSQGPGGDTAEASLTLEHVEVTAGVGAEAKRLSEPQVTASFRALRSPDDRIRVERLRVAAGEALRLDAPAPLEVSAAGPTGRRFAGTLDLTADLGRLAALKSFVPSLGSLRSGRVRATLDGRAAEGLDVGIGARMTQFALDPGSLAPEGYEEADVTLQARLLRTADGTQTVQVFGLTSALARLMGQQPFSATLAPSGALTFAGPLDLTIDLSALSRLAGTPLGLAKGERLRGTLGAKGSASGTADDGRLEATLAGRDLAFPASWSEARTAGALDGSLTLTWTRSALLLDVKDLRGLGLTAAGQAALKRDPVSTAFDGAELTLGADLAQVRERFGARLGLAPGASLSGQVNASLKASSDAGRRRLSGTTRIAGLVYRSGADAAPLEEPALTLEHTLVAGPGSSPWSLETGRARGNGYLLDLSGSSFSGEAPRRVELTGRIEGDAARLAERVRAFLGPDYRDLTGVGKVTGKVSFRSGGPDLLAAGTADADLTLGTWSAAGGTLADGRLTVKRTAASGPYQTALTGTLNQGTASVGLSLEPRGPALAWRLVTALKGVDLSTVIGNHGAGQYLGYVLPTLVPMDKATPMLSGRLDADLDLAAADLTGDPALASLAGRGTVALTQGTLGESTLFGAIAGGNGLGDVGKTLLQVVPEVGQELANLQKTLAFQSLTSRFEVGNRRVDVKETHLTGSALRIDLSGTVEFDQRVALAARLWIGSRAGEALKRAVPDQTLPLKITNTLDKPRVLPDLNAADLLKGALPGLLPGGGESPEALKKRLEDELKKRLKNPFR